MVKGALLDYHDWICRKGKSVTRESSLRKGQGWRKHRQIPRWRWGRVCAILAFIKLTAFDRKKKKVSHNLLSSCQNLLLSSACSILNFLHPHPPPELPSSSKFFLKWVPKLWDYVVRFHHRLWHLAPLEPTLVSVFGVMCLWQDIYKDNLGEDAFSWAVASESLVHHGQFHPIWIHDWALWWQRQRSVAAHRVDGNQSQGQVESRAR